ncbi:hypothetical protein O181_032690 [Austropuccinia psidii MF-1]|uniref:Uncharacterized protein n=1 Tax=Austropuccinia psidii MF-1 TaxID=1389203 RepID=A0A9Q3D021_9BASI|nr:hypothetical protein [Austropuccinia psidii MF-1]
MIHDSGASRSMVGNLKLLMDSKPINTKRNTLSGTFSVTHMDKLNFSGTILYPVYYCPDGKSNLIYQSQLEDHGLRRYRKNKIIIIQSVDRIIKVFQ